MPFDLSGGVSEVTTESVHSVTFDYAIGDETHGSGNHVGASVPLGGPGAGVGTTSFAGPKSGLLRGCGGREEPHVLCLRRADGAAGAAVDMCCDNGGEEPTVEP